MKGAFVDMWTIYRFHNARFNNKSYLFSCYSNNRNTMTLPFWWTWLAPDLRLKIYLEPPWFGPIFKAFVGTKVQLSTVKLRDGSVLHFFILGHRGQVLNFWARALNFEKRLVSFTMSIRPSAWNLSTPTGQIFIKFNIWIFFENLSRKFEVY